MKKLLALLAFILILSIPFAEKTFAVSSTECEPYLKTANVWWDGVELRTGQIGRLTVLQDTNLYKLNGDKKSFSRVLKAGETYRIYAFKPGMLSVGGGYYVDRDTKVKYQTPSKGKLQAVSCINYFTKIAPSEENHDPSKIEWIVEPSLNYTGVSEFSEGMAIVEKNSKYGFINIRGKEVIAPTYTWAKSFSEGLAAVRKGDKWGFVDKASREVIPPIYQDVFSFEDGLAIVKKNGKWGAINNKGKLKIAMQYDELSYSKENKLAYLRQIGNGSNTVSILDVSKGKFLIQSADAISGPINGLIRVQKNNKWGYMDLSGKMVIPFTFADAGDFYDGLAFVGQPDSKNGGLKYGYINKKGKIVIPTKYLKAGDFSEGIATVGTSFNSKTENWDLQLIDKNGKNILGKNLAYSSISTFHNGLAVVEYWDKQNAKIKYGLMNNKGVLTSPIIYDKISNFDYFAVNGGAPYPNGIIFIEKDGKTGILDKYGKILVDTRDYSYMDFVSDDTLEVGKDGSLYLMNLNNFSIIDNTEHQDGLFWGNHQVYNLPEGPLYSVPYYNYASLINQNGQQVMPLIDDLTLYDSVSVSEGVVVISEDGKWGIAKLPHGYSKVVN